MQPENETILLKFIEQVMATAQAGLTYSKDKFDIERFERLNVTAAALMAQASTVDMTAIKHWISLDKGYPTPKMDVRAMILNEHDWVLLVRERSDGRWTLPGGWCDIDESPARSAEREVLEETGLECSAIRLLALFDKRKHKHPPQIPHAYKAFFHCEITGGEIVRETNETDDVNFFAIDSLPALSVHRVLPEQIQTLHHRIKNSVPDALFD